MLSVSPLFAQVLSPLEVDDPGARALQQRYAAELRACAEDLRALHFPYAFYFSRHLDLDERDQKKYDAASVQFDSYSNQKVLEITGNYYAAYLGDRMDRSARFHSTYRDVMLPLLKATVPHFDGDLSFDAFALEISHHVQQKVMGVVTERPENLVLVVPVENARKLVKATGAKEQQAALIEAQAFLNGDPVELQVGEKDEFAVINRDPPETANSAAAPKSRPATVGGPVAAALERMKVGTDNEKWNPAAPFNTKQAVAVDLTPVRDTSAASLKNLQYENPDKLYRLVKQMQAQANFVSYAPPSFIAFHDHIYLQLSLTTDLPASSGGSRYKLAALAFDDHIAHLIRPVATYFQNQSDFDGIVFSTSIHVPGTDAPEAVEFFLPFSGIHCYEQYDCTGQQLITSSYVFINGERVSLDLETAEAR
ncbi:MAG: hypothetical protein JOZ10_08950 [Acidobacteria bacterium]|nr:hypothetical protein [Acidobacteriota bacterium]MBV9146093.1 hypothetical protein [Acidobacteriota bacterium]